MIWITRRSSLLLGLILPIALATAAGCERGANETRLRADLQATLDREVKAGLFTVTSVRREGSARMPAGESGAQRVLLYFSATLRLADDYSFGGLDELSPSTLAYALGGIEKGLVGLRTRNRAGDLVRAYGSAIYEWSGNAWMPIDAAPAGATPSDGRHRVQRVSRAR